jgi:hypothetical protein
MDSAEVLRSAQHDIFVMLYDFEYAFLGGLYFILFILSKNA